MYSAVYHADARAMIDALGEEGVRAVIRSLVPEMPKSRWKYRIVPDTEKTRVEFFSESAGTVTVVAPWAVGTIYGAEQEEQNDDLLANAIRVKEDLEKRLGFVTDQIKVLTGLKGVSADVGS